MKWCLDFWGFFHAPGMPWAVLTVCLEKAQEKSRPALILGLLHGPAGVVLVSVHQCYLPPPMKSLISASSQLLGLFSVWLSYFQPLRGNKRIPSFSLPLL